MPRKTRIVEELNQVEPKVVEKEIKKDEPVKEKSIKKETKTGFVDTSLLNVRAAASTTAKVVTTIPGGTGIEILGEEGDWYKISDGYVMKRYIR